MAPLVWLITGCTSGAGLALVHSVAARGDLVIATGRNASSRLSELSSSPSIAVLDLDVVSPLAEIQTIMASAVAIFGRIDVLVNNAGMARGSSVEEASEDLVRKLFDINLFGAIKVTQAVLPHMRKAKTGTVAFIGAGLGWAVMPFMTYYSTTKAALTLFAEGLQNEITPLGLRSVIFEPGGFDSQFAAPKPGEVGFAEPPKIDDYLPLYSKVWGITSGEAPKLPGDIAKLPGAIIDVIKGEGLAKGRPFPVRVVLGPDSLDAIRQKCNEQLQLCDTWEDMTLSVMVEGRRETGDWLLGNISILNKS
ncbi:hypothetical protein B0T17DRAFT_619732 [Bombardia bombarda]|uniref:Uncharacterized protein n=1 Tax=Bombardia bombarda TaxID=252184 RepID=A0AA39WGB3_9PEZI|nr:hypothetical protein B0T17DRAFT_619732 [Bombardia bombarda]